MVGFEYRTSGGRLYAQSRDSLFAKADPFFRAGIAVLPNVAVGAELALFHTFPRQSDVFTSTPVFCFGPAATYFSEASISRLQAFFAAGAGATYGFVWDRMGWRLRLGAGLILDAGLPVAFGIEGGWYHDVSQTLGLEGGAYKTVWLHGDSGFLGIRVAGSRR
jgi:hypothetical protein